MQFPSDEVTILFSIIVFGEKTTGLQWSGLLLVAWRTAHAVKWGRAILF